MSTLLTAFRIVVNSWEFKGDLLLLTECNMLLLNPHIIGYEYVPAHLVGVQ